VHSYSAAGTPQSNPELAAIGQMPAPSATEKPTGSVSARLTHTLVGQSPCAVSLRSPYAHCPCLVPKRYRARGCGWRRQVTSAGRSGARPMRVAYPAWESAQPRAMQIPRSRNPGGARSTDFPGSTHCVHARVQRCDLDEAPRSTGCGCFSVDDRRRGIAVPISVASDQREMERS
jgi:hypothetical protein